MATQTQTEIVPRLQHDGTVSIATGTSRHSIKWKKEELSWSDLARKLAETSRTPETHAEYMKLGKAEQDQVKDVGGFVGGILKGGRRKADAVAWRQVVTLDADFVKGDIWPVIEMMFDHAGLIYSTHKHTPAHPRVRFVLPLTRPVTAEEYVAISKRIAADIGIDMFDDTTYQPHRLMYWPSTSRDGEFLFEIQDAPWLNPDEVLARYIDWRDPLEWPESSRQKQIQKRMADKQGDPYDKPGMVGAFCRAYSIEEAIETFLPDAYTVFGEGRYTYTDGSTAGGLILYDDGKFAYSHHGTDPVSGLLVNSFDLVRIHLFGEQDEDAKPGTPISRMPSNTAMRELAQKDDFVKEAAARERVESAFEDFNEVDGVERVEDQDFKWARKLTQDKRGEVEMTVPNVVLILENDPLLKGKIATNAFSNRLMVMGDVPWRKVPAKDNWKGQDDSGIRDYLERVYKLYSRPKTEDAINKISIKNTFHPVREYLDPLEWDGVPRLETLFIEYLGAEDSELNRAITRKAFAAAVARIYKPGIKFDYMVTLYGAQGIGKSMILDRMGREWFSDSLTSVSGKEAYEALQGAWLIEMGELSATRKADVESIKGFISKREDRFRVAYGKHVEDFPRQCVFFGTTNDVSFLKDKTGGRRFWPITVNADKRKKRWSELTDSDIGQLWAEAKHYFKEGESLYLNDALEADMRKVQQAHTEESPWFGMVQEYLNRLLPEDWEDRDLSERRMFLQDDFGESEGTVLRDRVCALEVWQECLGNDAKRFSPMDRREINDILRTMPDWKPNDSNQDGRLRFGKIYGIQRGYVREKQPN